MPLILAVVAVILCSALATPAASALDYQGSDGPGDNIAIMAEKMDKAHREAKSSMQLFRLRIANKLAASEENLAKQLELLRRYDEQLQGAESSEMRSDLQTLTAQTRTTVTLQVDALKQLIKKLQETQAQMDSDEEPETAPTPPTISLGTTEPAPPPPVIAIQPKTPSTPPSGG